MNHAPREALKVVAYGVYRSVHLDAMATRRGQAYVLNLHRVHPDPSSYSPPIHPDDLDWLIGRLRRLGTFVSVEEVSSRRVPAKARLFALSFDDEYDDFLSHALPVIASHGVPVNLNVVGSSLVSGLRSGMRGSMTPWAATAPAWPGRSTRYSLSSLVTWRRCHRRRSAPGSSPTFGPSPLRSASPCSTASRRSRA